MSWVSCSERSLLPPGKKSLVVFGGGYVLPGGRWLCDVVGGVVTRTLLAVPVLDAKLRTRRGRPAPGLIFVVTSRCHKSTVNYVNGRPMGAPRLSGLTSRKVGFAGTVDDCPMSSPTEKVLVANVCPVNDGMAKGYGSRATPCKIRLSRGTHY